MSIYDFTFKKQDGTEGSLAARFEPTEGVQAVKAKIEELI